MSTLRTAHHFLLSLFQRGTHVLYELCFKPRAPTEDTARKERILLIVMFGVLLLLWSFEFINFYKATYAESAEGMRYFVVYTILVAFFTALFVCARAGYYELVSYVFIILFLGGVVYGTANFGVGLPIGLLSYGVVITMASSILGNRFAFLITGSIVGSILIVGYHEIQSGVLPAWKGEMVQVSDLIEYSIMLGLIMLLSWLSNKELQKSLSRAQSSEAELKEERDNLERTVQERTKALMQAEYERVAQLTHFAEFGKISAGLFHNLLNPLTAVSMAVSRLDTSNNKNPLTKQARESVERAINATHKMEHFIATVRKNIKTEEFLERFSVNTEVHDVLEMIRFKAGRFGVNCIFKPSQEVVMYGNCLKFNQVISNIVSNALDAYADSLLSPRRRIVRIFLKERSGLVTIRIADRGMGIPQHLQETIFKPFVTTKAYGIGLGLSTAKDIVERDFNGTIAIASTEEVGTTVTISIPLSSHA